MEKKFDHLMVDLETLGVNANSIVLTIAAVPFDIKTGETGKPFEVFPIVETQNRKYNWSTIKWWFSQDEVVRTQQAEAKRDFDLDICLDQLSVFCKDNLEKNFRVWGNGFDIPLLNQAYDDYGLKTPWSYKNIFDMRTIVWLSKVSVKKHECPGTQHDAVDDCIWQINVLKDAYNILKNYR